MAGVYELTMPVPPLILVAQTVREEMDEREYICVCIYIYVCIYIFSYVCAYMYMCVCMYGCMNRRTIG